MQTSRRGFFGLTAAAVITPATKPEAAPAITSAAKPVIPSNVDVWGPGYERLTLGGVPMVFDPPMVLNPTTTKAKSEA